MNTSMASAGADATRIILYGHARCPQVGPVKSILNGARAPFEYVNIRQDAAAAERVRQINNGNESVPTLIFPDGSTLTEPSVGQLRDSLARFGYQIRPTAWLTGNLPKIAIGLGIALAVARALGWF
ncbi:MAG TPA: glutaredoxin domain-containing protein [Herpetosiphonaceae bacterium]|nr:glutaredoxin domain-containing protein [Herpetosiphonaceae bacterium]